MGIEGPVGSGKTSICRQLLKQLPNTILVNGGNLYRAIVYAYLQKKKNIGDIKKETKNIDIKKVMEQCKVEIRIENQETKIYIAGKAIEEEKIQSKEASMAVSVVGGNADNQALFVFARNLIDNLKKTNNVIIAGRSIMEIYPDTDYHFFITATLEERVKRKYIQYKGEIAKEEIKANIQKRDELQEKAGFYQLHDKTITLDVTDCKTIEESTNKVLENLRSLTTI